MFCPSLIPTNQPIFFVHPSTLTSNSLNTSPSFPFHSSIPCLHSQSDLRFPTPDHPIDTKFIYTASLTIWIHFLSFTNHWPFLAHIPSLHVFFTMQHQLLQLSCHNLSLHMCKMPICLQKKVNQGYGPKRRQSTHIKRKNTQRTEDHASYHMDKVNETSYCNFSDVLFATPIESSRQGIYKTTQML